MKITGYKYIQHKIKPRPWGPECQFTVARPDGTHINEVIPIPSIDASESVLAERIQARLAMLEAVRQAEINYEKDRCRLFDGSGPEIREALSWVVRKIRQNTGITYAQAEAAWNEERADSPFTFAKLAAWLQRRIDANITWGQFKTYVIDHKFDGVD